MDVFVPIADDDDGVDDDDGADVGEASIGRDGPGTGSSPGSDVPAVADIGSNLWANRWPIVELERAQEKGWLDNQTRQRITVSQRFGYMRSG